MLKHIIGSLLLYLSLSADPCYTLGSKDHSLSDNINNAIIWQHKNDQWFASLPKENLDKQTLKCQKQDYILINNDDISFKTPGYDKKSYKIKQGWNYLHSHKKGIDIIETFKNSKDIEFVYVYDEPTHVWAGYSPNKNIQETINSTRIAFLEDIEPNTGFYVYAKKEMSVDIRSKDINAQCKKYIDDKKYDFIENSGTNIAFNYDKKKVMGLRSRYVPHFKRGIYSDSRVVLIYPKTAVKSKKRLKYGPAKPKSVIEYAKEYEGKTFYMYSYKDEKCYMGVFPSMMIPPFASLKEIK